jgi:hypothetical protein
MRMIAAMNFAFVASRAHVACQPRENKPKGDEENPASHYDPLGGGDLPVEGKLGEVERCQHGVYKEHGVDERDKPAPARSRLEADSNISNGVFGSHGFPISGVLLLAYTC